MSGDEHRDAGRIKALGWRQGSILPPELAKDMLAEHPGAIDPRTEILLVVSHDCDVTNGSFANEPFVELMKARLVAPSERDGALSFGKNPRRIQFEVEIGDEQHVAEASAHDRFFVPRQMLLDSGPDTNRRCTALTVRQIGDWLARRYVRSAFPDVFNKRIGPAQTRIRKALKSHGHDITGVFVAMESWEELPDNEPYRIVVTATMKEDVFDERQRRQYAQVAVDKIEQELDACHGIEITESVLASEREISLADRRLMHRFDYDDLSLRDEDGDIAPRG